MRTLLPIVSSNDFCDHVAPKHITKQEGKSGAHKMIILECLMLVSAPIQLLLMSFLTAILDRI
jgi:hypothetical protein